MEPHDVKALADVMERLAAGEEKAVLALLDRFGNEVGATVRVLLRARGWQVVRDDLDGLVFDACEAIAEAARSWSPDGALPWVYARPRIANRIDRVLGQRTVPLHDHVGPLDLPGWPDRGRGDDTEATEDDGRPLSAVLAGLAASNDLCRLLQEAFRRAPVSETDRDVLLLFVTEQDGGNRAPATTVGATFRLEPGTVRQRVHRARQRLQRLAASDDRFAALAELPLLTPPRRAPAPGARRGRQTTTRPTTTTGRGTGTQAVPVGAAAA